jgi:uncharacterized damage-inducible protein DinB
MSESGSIGRIFEETIAGSPWHGPSLAAVLDGIDSIQAARRPIEGAHSIWEIVLHVTGWTREVARRLEGGEPAMPGCGDWPEPGPAEDAPWKADKADLEAAHGELLAALTRFAPSRLDERLGAERDAPLGTGVSFREMILGVLQHDAYHAGQIALLKKARDAGRRG